MTTSEAPATPVRRRALTWVALLAVIAGVLVVAVAVRAQQSAPPPRSVGRIDDNGPAPGSGGSGSAPASAGTVRAAPLPASRPVRISIPAIGVRSVVNPIGLAKDGTLAVPQPGPHLDEAAWFRNSPSPGQPGPSIIEGHVDSTRGPSVFFKLGRLRPGHRIVVTRGDGVRAVFTVHAVRDFPKSHFPTTLVYGARDLGRPQLRLITCSDFDTGSGHHTGNAVVFADLTSVLR